MAGGGRVGGGQGWRGEGLVRGGFGAGRRPGGGAADAGGARGFRRSRNGLRPGAGDFLRDLGGEGLGRAAGPAAEPPTRAKPAGFGEAETACGRGRGFDFLGALGGVGEGRRPGGGAADAAQRAACPRRRRGRPAARSGRLRKNSPDRGRSGRGLRLGVGPWGGDVFAEDGV